MHAVRFRAHFIDSTSDQLKSRTVTKSPRPEVATSTATLVAQLNRA